MRVGYLYLVLLLSNAFESVEKIEFTLRFIKKDIVDTWSLFHLKLKWKNIIYSCNKLPKRNISKYQCDNSDIIETRLIIDDDDGIMMEYDSSSRIFIESIKFWILDEYNNNLFFYKIDEFCVPIQYNYLLNPMKSNYPLPVITRLRHGVCAHFKIQRKSDQYKHQKYGNIALGNPSKFKYHKILFLKDINNYKNQSIEALILPPEIQSFIIKTSDLRKDPNPQTSDPVNLLLIWFNNVYECKVYPKIANTTYECDVNNKSVNVYSVNQQYYGNFMLLIEKDELSTNSLVIDKIVVIGLLNTFYGINSFCISLGLYDNSRICSAQHTEENKLNHCHGFIDYKMPSDSFIKCDRSCLDTNYCWKYKLFYHFVDNFLLYPNQSRQCKVTSAIFANPQIYNSLSDESELRYNINLITTFIENNMNDDNDDNHDNSINITLIDTEYNVNSTLTEYINISLYKFVQQNETEIILGLIIFIVFIMITLIASIVILCCQRCCNGCKLLNISNDETYFDSNDTESESITDIDFSNSRKESHQHSLSVEYNDNV